MTAQSKSPDSLAERVEKEIEQSILRGEFGPGSRISENALASRFGVSRGPVREACRSLARAGLLKIVPHQGTFVRSLALQEVVNLFDIRASLGRLAGREAAAAIDKSGINRLRELIASMDQAAADGNATTYIELNLEFHACLYDATGNRRLAELDRSLRAEMRIYRRHGLAFGGGLAVSNQEHRAILASIEKGDQEAAGQKLEDHILRGRDRFLRAMAATGQLVLRDEPYPTTENRKRRGT
ncbi:MAG TPA: GntR family transcriptional regulator [Alphaproteobacteria bacterium]|nr:GntR family transcriptional regulator [Alphaproteobacteria bacterium]